MAGLNPPIWSQLFCPEGRKWGMLDGRRLTDCLKLTNPFKLEDASQNMAVAFDKAKTETN